MTKEKQKGRWQPGQSGNPAGRPRGTSNVTKLREALMDDIPAVLDRLVEQAKEGDVAAARLLLERTVPPTKPVELPVEITWPAEGDLSTYGHAILDALAEAKLTPGQAAQLMTGLGNLAHLMEVDELAKRIDELEAKHESKP